MQRVAVVGGGLIGLASAWRLAQAGCRVQLFDGAPEAREASWAAAGMLAPHHEAESCDDLWRMGVDSLAQWPGFLGDLGADAADVDFRAEGGWVLAQDQATLDRQVERAHRLGVEHRVVAAGHLPGVQAHGAVWLPAAQVDPRRVLIELRAACRQAGVDLRYGDAVTGFTAGAISTGGGREHAADEIVLASGAWTPALARLAGLDLPGIPVHGQMLRLDANLDLLPGFLREGSHYLVPRRGGGVVVGSTMSERGFDHGDDPQAVAELSTWAARQVPALAGAPVAETWTGLRPRLADGQVAIRRLRPGLVVATGHFRNGVLLTPATAARVRDLVLSR